MNGPYHATGDVAIMTVLPLYPQSFLMVDTHSSLKTTSLGLDLSSTGGGSVMNTGRDENVHFLANLDDDDDDDDEVRFIVVIYFTIYSIQ